MRLFFSILIGAGFYLPLSLFAGDLDAGRIKAEKSCAVCHGVDGQATVPLAAHISGQQKDYLIIQLRAYRSGKRPHDQMGFIAKPLTNEDIDNLAEWYSSIKVNVEKPEELDVQESSNASTPELDKENTIKNNNDADLDNNSDMIVMDPKIIQAIQDSMQSFK